MKPLYDRAMRDACYYTIPPGCAFATDLAAGLLMRHAPEIVARTEIYLPTRRAVRTLQDAFLQQSKGKALLLPKMRAIGDIDDDDYLALQSAFSPDAFVGSDERGLPPAMAPMRRLCLIARQVQAFPIGGQRPSEAQAFALARALIQLLDQTQNAEYDIAQMADLWPKELASHWQDIAQFLSIMWRFWPAILEQEGAMDPVARRIAMMGHQAQIWADNPPDYPVIIAGSTGTLPATQNLMKIVASLPQGEVIFPGMIPDISDEDWQAISADQVHPLHPLSITFAALGIRANEVAIWPASIDKKANAGPRIRFLQEVMRPASQTEKWRALGGTDDKALMQKESYHGFQRLEAQDSHEEAAIIALAMRAALEVPEKTAILVTADRQLARMVQSELRRFDIEIDDSAGEPLSQTSLGTYLALLARLISSQNVITDLMALAAHPLSSGQCDRVLFRQKMNELNKDHLRGNLLFDDVAGLLAHLGKTPELKTFVQTHLITPLSPLLIADGTASLSDCAALLGSVAERFAATSDEDTSEAVLRLWAGPAGQAAAQALQELGLYGDDFTTSYQSFADILHVIFASIDVRVPFQKQSRLSILGAVESRMISADLVILSGLNEGVWPPKAGQDLWMNQAMAEAMGLPHKQWRIALSAHDFMMAAAMPEVLITRSRRANDSPTLPSRWLTRMDAVMSALQISDLIAPKIPHHVKEILDHRTNHEPKPIAPPAPKPPVAIRPTTFSATQFDTLIGDPYSIYARRILRLRALAPLNEPPNAALKGTLIHEALCLFTRHYPNADSRDGAQDALLKIAEPLFAPWLRYYEVRHFWWPQFCAIAAWFTATDRVMYDEADVSFAEIEGAVSITHGERTFSVTAKADRIIRHSDGRISIIDYKTGSVPAKKAVSNGRKTQMLVEAALIGAAGYKDITSHADIKSLAYWKLQGRGQKSGIVTDVTPEELDTDRLLEVITDLLARFEDEAMAYHAEPDPRGRPPFSDYRHLSRIKEWRSLEVGDD